MRDFHNNSQLTDKSEECFLSGCFGDFYPIFLLSFGCLQVQNHSCLEETIKFQTSYKAKPKLGQLQHAELGTAQPQLVVIYLYMERN